MFNMRNTFLFTFALFIFLNMGFVIAAPNLNGHNLNYDNYWMVEDQVLPLSIYCSGAEEITYSWKVDGEIVSLNQTFILDGSIGVGEHEVIGECSFLKGGSQSQTFNINIVGVNEFSIVIMPDTQYYSQNYPDTYIQQAEWVAEMSQRMNLVFLTHEGDIVQNAELSSEWDAADESMDIIENAGINYGAAIGNHDYLGSPGVRNSSAFDQYFGPSRFQEMSTFGGSRLPDSVTDMYHILNVSEEEFLMLYIEYCPREASLNWAHQVVGNNSDKKVILTTHSYLDDEFDLPSSPDLGSIPSAHCNNGNLGAYGKKIWQDFARQHSNMFMILSGHFAQDDGTGYLASKGINGNPVHQIVTNYQTPVEPQGGNGYLRIMTFNPDIEEIRIKSYSPVLDSYKTEPSQEFVLEYFPELDDPVFLPEDLNQDDFVNGADLAALLAQWGECNNCTADFNNDSIVNGIDLSQMLANWT